VIRFVLERARGYALAEDSEQTSQPTHRANPEFLGKLKDMLLSEDYRGDEINALIEGDPTTFFALAQLLGDQNPEIRAGTIGTLLAAAAYDTTQTEFYLQEVHDSVAPQVLALLEDPSPKVREQAAMGVWSFPDLVWGELLEEATPRLHKLLYDVDPEVQNSAGMALRMAAQSMSEDDPARAVRLLLELAEHPSARVRRWGAWVVLIYVGNFRAVEAKFITLLAALTNDPVSDVRDSARKTLESFNQLAENL